MYCSRCGNKLGDGDAFCSNCGCPTTQMEKKNDDGNTLELMEQKVLKECPDGVMVKEQEQRQKMGIVQEEKAKRTKGSKQINKPQKYIFIAAFLFVVLVIVAYSSKIQRTLSPLPTNNNYYALPELPDNISVWDLNTDNEILITDNNELIENIVNVSVAANGTIAYQTEEGGVVYIQGKELGKEISKSVKDFELSGSGSKIVYSTEDGIYVQDVTRKKGKKISNRWSNVENISYAGNVVGMNSWWDSGGTNYEQSCFSKDGAQAENSWDGSIAGISSDGKYIYYTKGRPEDYMDFYIDIDGNEHKILTVLSDQYPNVVAYSNNYEEILFSAGNEIYYFSAKDNSEFEAQYVDTIENRILLPININSNRQEHRIMNNFYLIEDDESEMPYSVVKLNEDLTLTTLFSGIPWNGYNTASDTIHLSEDGTKLWCISQGTLAFCDLAKEDKVVSYGNEPLYSNVEIRTDVANSLAVSSDGLKAYAIGADGTLLRFTPGSLNNPEIVDEGALYVYYASDDCFYVIKNESQDTYDMVGDLYAISEGSLDLIHENVLEMYSTKNNQYFVEQPSEDSYNCQLYYKDWSKYSENGSEWSVLREDVSSGCEPHYWGKNLF